MELKPYPTTVCKDCGLAASKGRMYEISTWHKGLCEVCGLEKFVTEPRDFFHPRFDGFQDPRARHG